MSGLSPAERDAVGKRTYLDMYESRYGEYMREGRLVEGRDAVSMVRASQPAGAYPDEPVSDYVIMLNISEVIHAKSDLGAGAFSYKMPRNTFVISPPRTATDHQVETQNDLSILGLPSSYFETALADLNVEDFSIEPLLSDTHADPVIARLMHDAWREVLTGREHGALFVDTTVLAIVSRVIGLATRAGISQSSSRRLDARTMALITEYVESNVDSAIRMKTLANITGLNEYEFARQFRAKTGKPPYQWVIDRRLDRAEQMLKRSEHSLADIAYACGFSSQAHMTSLFSRKRGVTPLQLRIAYRN